MGRLKSSRLSSLSEKSVPHLIVNQVVKNTKRDVFMKKSLVLSLKNVSAYLTYIKRMVQGRFTQRFLEIIIIKVKCNLARVAGNFLVTSAR